MSSSLRSLFPSLVSVLVVLLVVMARRPARQLQRRGATSPATARPLSDFSAGDRRRLARLVAQGVVREAAPGMYYYDQAGDYARRRAKLPLVLALAVGLLLLTLVLAYSSARRAGGAA